jgi:hypothetical protein
VGENWFLHQADAIPRYQDEVLNRKILITLYDETNFVKGVRKIKVNYKGYKDLINLIEDEKLDKLLELGSSCKEMLQEVNFLSEEDKKRLLIEDINLGHDVDN